MGGLPSPSKNLTEEEKSMAVLNLQAMLNIEDFDKVLELLEENNWDETAAASQHMAH